jgi:hypothetical protein
MEIDFLKLLSDYLSRSFFVKAVCYLPSSAVWLISAPDARFHAGGPS